MGLIYNLFFLRFHSGKILKEFFNISADFMNGWPGQVPAGWADSENGEMRKPAHRERRAGYPQALCFYMVDMVLCITHAPVCAGRKVRLSAARDEAPCKGQPRR